mmetsp:Transcript_119/g.391  ORF Transcript_119/g.391 Transcript_119/m.391 type:complete len:227 (-) Transcript_119:1358-2038(-)
MAVMPIPVDDDESPSAESSADAAADTARPEPFAATDRSADEVCSTSDASTSRPLTTEPTASIIVDVSATSPLAAVAAATTVWQTPSPLPSENASSKRPVVRFASAAPASPVGATAADVVASADPPSASDATTTRVTFGEPSGRTTSASDPSRVGALNVLSVVAFADRARVLNAYCSGASSVTQLCVSSVNWVSSAKPRDGDATSLPEDGGRATKKLMDATPSTEPN